jgi:hypothetical protein
MNRDTIISALLRRLATECAAAADAIESTAREGAGNTSNRGEHQGRDREPGDDRQRESFVGFRLRSKFEGKCCVCGNRYNVGDQVLYSKERKRSACLGCGREDG